MEIVWKILWAIVAISSLVTVHEFGHYWVARKLGFKVLRFSVGFGKPLWKRVGRAPDRIEYVIAAIPLGGYVRMADQREGEVSPEDLPRAFGSRPPWQRILVLLAGPAANFIFAIAVLWLVFWIKGDVQLKPFVGDVLAQSRAANVGMRSGDLIVDVNGEPVRDQMDTAIELLDAMSNGVGRTELRLRSRDGAERTVVITVPDEDERKKLTAPGELWAGLGFEFWRPTQPATISGVVDGGPAALAGLQAGDTFVSIDGQPVRSWVEFASYVRARPGQSMVFEVRRAETVITKRIVAKRDLENGKEIGRLMVAPPTEPVDLVERVPDEYKIVSHFGPLKALGAGVGEAWDLTVVQAKFFWRMVTLKVSSKNLSSVITIADYAGKTASAGPEAFFMLLVMLSLALGFLNLLPIPILDGGQIVFQVMEWARGRALSERAHYVAQHVGLAAIVLLMGVALFNDVSTHFLPAR